MTFAFARAATTYAALAADTDTLSSELSGALSMLDGMSGLPIDAHMDRLQHTISQTASLALSMQETSNVCTQQDSFDVALSEAPTPDEVAEAKNRAVRTYVLYHQGGGTLAEAVQAQREADQLQAERDAAVEQHAADTAGTCFTVPQGGGWQPEGSGESESDPWGEDEGSGSDDEDETEPETTPPPDTTGLRRLPLIEPDIYPVIPQGYTPEPEAVGGTDLSSSLSPTPSAQSLTSPSGVYTPAPSVSTLPNQPTAASPQWMQPTAPVTTQQAAQRPYAASQQSKQRRSDEERAAERWLTGSDTPAAAAVMTAHSVTSTPTVTSAPSAPSATPTPTTPATPTSAPTGAGSGAAGGGMAPGMAPGAAGHGQGKTAAATAPKIASADPVLQQAFEEAMRERPYEPPVREGLLGPIANPRQAEAGR